MVVLQNKMENPYNGLSAIMVKVNPVGQDGQNGPVGQDGQNGQTGDNWSSNFWAILRPSLPP